MSDVSQGSGWWQASDLKWYPPEQVPGPLPGADPAPAVDPGPLGDGAPPATPDWGASAQTSAWGTDVSSPAPAGPPPGYAPPGGPGVPYPGAPGPQAYGAYAPGYAPAYGGGYGSGLPSVSGLGTASLVLGILSLVLFWCWPLGGPLALIGLPLGLVALSRISKGQADPGARGIALGGAICSGIALVGVAGFMVLIFAS